jgi:polyisoprenoid-binding protein YceI
MSASTEIHLGTGVWRVDRTRSTVSFHVRHFGFAAVHGRFESFAGRLEVCDGELQVDAQVDVASVLTGNSIRDARLRSEFFDAERHPSSSLRASCGAPDGRLVGELTIRGVTRPVELTMTVGPGSSGAVHARAEGSIRRSDFGLDWGALREADRLLVADVVRITADVVLTPIAAAD